MRSEAHGALGAGGPSARASAIDELRNTATPADLPVLRVALQSETVASLRRQLAALVARLEDEQQLQARGGATAKTESLEDLTAILEENAVSWIRHELEPAIGWLRLAASREIEAFSESETNRAIEGLRRRLDNAEALVRATAMPKLSEVSMTEAVSVALEAGGIPSARVVIDIDDDRPDLIVTDLRLFELVVQNAIANALDAVAQLPAGTGHTVFVSGAVTGERMWLRISNQFTGQEFAMSEVEAVGVTVKDGHQGQGTSLMRHAAVRLGYQLRLRGEAGVAELVLTGPRQP